MAGGKFIAVGENIHCTRVLKVSGELVRELPDGTHAIVYREDGKEELLPIPDQFLRSSDWAGGKVRHAAVAVWQGLHGDAAGRRAGIGYLHSMVRRQEAHGASFLDLNVDGFSTQIEERIEAIRWLAGVVQEVCTVPLSIDSSNLTILKAGLESCNHKKGKPLANSVSLERRQAIPAAGQAGAVVIAAASGEASMPRTKEDRLENIEELMQLLAEQGFSLSEIYLDPLVFPVSVDPGNGKMILETIGELRKTYGRQIHFAPGLSNVSYGMPNRKLINQVFTCLCVRRGLDGGIVDPLQINDQVLAGIDEKAESFVAAKAFITGEDPFGMQYITAVRSGKI